MTPANESLSSADARAAQAQAEATSAGRRSRPIAWNAADDFLNEMLAEGGTASIRDYVRQTATKWALLHYGPCFKPTQLPKQQRGRGRTWPELAASLSRKFNCEIKPKTLSTYLAEAIREGLVDEKELIELAAQRREVETRARAEALDVHKAGLFRQRNPGVVLSAAAETPTPAPAVIRESAPFPMSGAAPRAPAVVAALLAAGSGAPDLEPLPLAATRPFSTAPIDSSSWPTSPAAPEMITAFPATDEEFELLLRVVKERAAQGTGLTSLLTIATPSGVVKKVFSPRVQQILAEGHIRSCDQFAHYLDLGRQNGEPGRS